MKYTREYIVQEIQRLSDLKLASELQTYNEWNLAAKYLHLIGVVAPSVHAVPQIRQITDDLKSEKFPNHAP